MATTIKHRLYELCRQHIAKGITAAEQAIADAREAMANETKSSAGDKYETSREMMQQEIDLNTARLGEMQKLKAALDMIDPGHQNTAVSAGSLVRTTQGNYYVAVSMGKLVVDSTAYYVLSVASPLGSRLTGLKAGDAITFNGKEMLVLEVA